MQRKALHAKTSCVPHFCSVSVRSKAVSLELPFAQRTFVGIPSYENNSGYATALLCAWVISEIVQKVSLRHNTVFEICFGTVACTRREEISSLFPQVSLPTASVVSWSEFLAKDPEFRVRFPAL
jgi:hypothetical protein